MLLGGAVAVFSCADMDIVPKSVLDGLRVCRDASLVSDRDFETIVEHASQTLLRNSEQQSEPKLSNNNTNVDAAKQCHSSCLSLLLEAAKLDIQEEQLGMILDDCNLPAKRKEAFIANYNHYKEDLRTMLSKIGRHPPNLVDVDWRLDYNIKNNRVHRVNELQYTISLKQDNGENVDLVCTKDELQDLVGKLKEASKALERASQV